MSRNIAGETHVDCAGRALMAPNCASDVYQGEIPILTLYNGAI